MNIIIRIGGWSAILPGIAMLVAFGLFIPTFTAMPAEAMEPENYAHGAPAFPRPAEGVRSRHPRLPVSGRQ